MEDNLEFLATLTALNCAINGTKPKDVAKDVLEEIKTVNISIKHHISEIKCSELTKQLYLKTLPEALDNAEKEISAVIEKIFNKE